MKRATKIAMVTIVAMVLATLGALFLPISAPNDNETFRVQLAINLALAIVYCGAATLFLVGLKTYKTEMRRAFTILSLGILLTALATVQLPIASAFGLIDTIWVKGGIIVIPFMLGGLVMYLGVRGFARLVGLQTLATRVSVVIPAAILFSTLSAFLPHPDFGTSEIGLDVSNGIIAWTGLLDLGSALIMLQVKKRIGAHYAHAMTWLSAAYVMAVIVTLLEFLHSLLASGALDAGGTIANLLTVALGGVFLRAGYVFTQTEDY